MNPDAIPYFSTGILNVAKISGLGKPDSKGRYTRDLGWKVRDDG